MNNFIHSIIGLPNSGKTTFLAALWHILDAGEISTDLNLETLSEDNTYLNAIVKAWRNYSRMPRTSAETESTVKLRLCSQSDSRRITLNFSDLDGESFNSQLIDRESRPEYIQAYESKGGILLFLNADRAQDGMSILDLKPILNPEKDENNKQELHEWRPDNVPEQVRLTELLQFLQRPPFVRRLRRLVVVISAWDVISSPQPTPRDWLSREFPFLFQYLSANPHSFEFRVFGVSAQGGQIPGSEDNPEAKEQRLKLVKSVVSHRIQCVESDDMNHDLTVPIEWLSRVE